MVGCNRVGDVLQQYGFACTRRCNDQGTLALSEWNHDVDNARRQILNRRIFRFHLEPLCRIERRQVVEMTLVLGCFWIFKVYLIDLKKSEVTFAILWASDLAFDCITCAQSKTADLRGRNINVIWAGEIIGIWRS